MLDNILNLEGVAVLSKKQQQLIKGSGVMTAHTAHLDGTCAYQGGNGYFGMSGVSKEDAIWGAMHTSGHWCCDSCYKATWLPQEHKDYLAGML